MARSTRPPSTANPDAIAHPWKWAAIHAGFVVAAAIAAVGAWRLNEAVRAETREAYRQAHESEQRFKGAFEEAPMGMGLVSILPESAGRLVQVNRAMADLLGYSEEELSRMTFQDITHPDDVEESSASFARPLTISRNATSVLTATSSGVWFTSHWCATAPASRCTPSGRFRM